MNADDPRAPPFSLKRWSQRKLDSARTSPPAPAAAVPQAAPPRNAPTDVPAADPKTIDVRAGMPTADPQTSDLRVGAPTADAQPLPPVESLTIDSDFTRFLGPKIDESLKRRALKQLFRDPRFNVMDGLDVYIDDYSQPDPIAADVVREMVQGRYIFDPPQTRVNEQGVVEDVPSADADAASAEERSVAAVEAAPDTSARVPAPSDAPSSAPHDVGPTEGPAAPREPPPAPR